MDNEKTTPKKEEKKLPPVDCRAEVRIGNGRMAAFVKLIPPRNGGNMIDEEGVLKALERAGVVYNIDEKAIRTLIYGGMFNTDYQVAEGTEPTEGTDGTISYVFSKDRMPVPEADENGIVDYRELGYVRTIYKGEKIADITLPVNGEDGTDVLGKPVKVRPSKPAQFNIGSNTEVTGEGTALIASTDGHIVFKSGAFCVEESVVIGGNLDASVGNIDFLGDVIIKGDVPEGYFVTSGKNVTITGNITGANIRAEGDIKASGCINSLLDASGNIKCKFCEYSSLVSAENIESEYFMNCDVRCGGNLISKNIGGGKYIVIGSVETTNLGNKTYNLTEIFAGGNAYLLKEKREVLTQIEENDEKIAKCTEILEVLKAQQKEQKGHLSENREEILANAVKTKLACQMRVKILNSRIKVINESLEELQDCSVSVTGKIFPGTYVAINEENISFNDEETKKKICLDADGQITMLEL